MSSPPHGDIPDDTAIRLVVLPPVSSHIWKARQSEALAAAGEILARRGEQPRLNQNRLLFLCADENAKSSLYDQVKRYLAWKSIVEDKDALNLDRHRLKEALANQKEYDARIQGALAETYKWILAPYQEADARGGVTPLSWEEARVTATDGDMAGGMGRVLVDSEMLIRQWSPFHLKNELEKWYFRDDQQDVGLLRLWNDFCRYPYLPRLADSAVLQETVTEGIKSRDFFGYAAGKEGDRYQGLVFGGNGSVYLDEDALVVHPDAAARQQAQERQDLEDKKNGVSGGGYKPGDGPDTGGTETGDSGQPVPPNPGTKVRRFYGTVQLNPVTASLDFSTIVQEVVQHFSSQVGTRVTISVEISAENEQGFSEGLRRAVRENCQTLGFVNAEFEEE